MFLIGRRDWQASEDFIRDASKRVRGPVQIATDPHRSYAPHIRAYFQQPGVSHGTDTKVFHDASEFRPELFPVKRKNGIPKIAKSEREAVTGNPNLATLTTSHIERFFLTMRQEVTRFTRMTLGYSKDLRMHKLATALHIGLYNLVRKHSSLDGRTPAQAACVEERRWSYEDVVELTETFMRRKEDAKFEAAFPNL